MVPVTGYLESSLPTPSRTGWILGAGQLEVSPSLATGIWKEWDADPSPKIEACLARETWCLEITRPHHSEPHIQSYPKEGSLSVHLAPFCPGDLGLWGACTCWNLPCPWDLTLYKTVLLPLSYLVFSITTFPLYLFALLLVLSINYLEFPKTWTWTDVGAYMRAHTPIPAPLHLGFSWMLTQVKNPSSLLPSSLGQICHGHLYGGGGWGGVHSSWACGLYSSPDPSPAPRPASGLHHSQQQCRWTLPCGTWPYLGSRVARFREQTNKTGSPVKFEYQINNENLLVCVCIGINCLSEI